jgi:hypothetical protein
MEDRQTSIQISIDFYDPDTFPPWSRPNEESSRMKKISKDPRANLGHAKNTMPTRFCISSGWNGSELID